ncbi:unnamed protein product, partial [Closterium sp. Naga37s-1]
RSAFHQLVLALRPHVPQQAPSSTSVWTAVRKEETRIAVHELLASGSARLIWLFQAVWDDHIHSETQRSTRHSRGYHHSWQLAHIHTVFNTCLSHLPTHSPLRTQLWMNTLASAPFSTTKLATWQQ